MHFEICAICGEQSRDNPRQWTPTPYSWIAVKSDQSPSLSLSQFYYSYFPNSDIAVVLVYCYFTQKKYNVKFIFINFLLSLRNLLTKYDGKWMAAFCFAFINNSLTHMFLVFFIIFGQSTHYHSIDFLFCYSDNFMQIHKRFKGFRFNLILWDLNVGIGCEACVGILLAKHEAKDLFKVKDGFNYKNIVHLWVYDRI